jgi:hypothetical protein
MAATVFTTTMFTTAAMEPRKRAFSTRLMARVSDVPLTIPRFVAVKVVKRLSTTVRDGSVVAVARIVAIIYVSIEPMMTMEPGPCADEQTTIEPVWTVIPVRRTFIRRVIKIPVRAYWLGSDIDRDLRRRNRGTTQSSRSNCCQRNGFITRHTFLRNHRRTSESGSGLPDIQATYEEGKRESNKDREGRGPVKQLILSAHPHSGRRHCNRLAVAVSSLE